MYYKCRYISSSIFHFEKKKNDFVKICSQYGNVYLLLTPTVESNEGTWKQSFSGASWLLSPRDAEIWRCRRTHWRRGLRLQAIYKQTLPLKFTHIPIVNNHDFFNKFLSYHSHLVQLVPYILYKYMCKLINNVFNCKVYSSYIVRVYCTAILIQECK